MKRSTGLQHPSIVILAVLIGGAALAHSTVPPSPALAPSCVARHAGPVKPPVTPGAIVSVIPSDPVPNIESPPTGAPLDGGIRWSRQVHLDGETSAAFERAVGSRGRDEDGSRVTATGLAEAAHEVALNLKRASRPALRLGQAVHRGGR